MRRGAALGLALLPLAACAHGTPTALVSAARPKDVPSCYSDLQIGHGHVVQCNGDKDAASARLPPDVETVDLCSAPLSDGSALGALGGLRSLVLSHTKGLANLAFLAKLQHLEALDLSGYTPPGGAGAVASNMAFVGGVRSLRMLRLADTGIADLTPLSNLDRLEYLDLTNSPATDLSPLAGLRQLRYLVLHGAHVTDIGPLAGLTALEGLDLAMTGVTDVAALRELHAMRDLYLDNDYVYDLAPLRGMTRLRWLGVGGVPVSNDQRFALEELLSAGRGENERMIAGSATHDHYGASCPTYGAFVEAPFSR